MVSLYPQLPVTVGRGCDSIHKQVRRTSELYWHWMSRPADQSSRSVGAFRDEGSLTDRVAGKDTADVRRPAESASTSAAMPWKRTDFDHASVSQNASSLRKRHCQSASER